MRRGEWILTLCMRGILGMLGIYLMNLWLHSKGISTGVGINPATVLTSGILGFPGFVALYAISFSHLL